MHGDSSVQKMVRRIVDFYELPLAELTRQATEFADKQLPILKALGVRVVVLQLLDKWLGAWCNN